MSKMFVYLAGPIYMCSEAEAQEWRLLVSALLPKNIIGVSPLRGQMSEHIYDRLTTDEIKYGTAEAINAKNWLDTSRCDLILAYLPKELNERRPSYGTIIEIGWAIGMRKPIILVSDDDHLLNHPLITMNVGWRLPDLNTAVEVISDLYGVYATA